MNDCFVARIADCTKEKISILESEIELSEVESSTPDEPEIEASVDEESPMAGIAQMMKNPAMKEMVRSQQKVAMEISFGSLFEYLDLSDDDMKTFKELLLEKQMAVIDLSLEMMD